MKRLIDAYLKEFSNGADWRQNFLEHCHPNIILRTPIGLTRGIKSAKHFFSELDDLLHKATVKVTRFSAEKGQIIFFWRAIGPTSEVRNGRGWLRIADGRIVEHKIDCAIEPRVLNHG